MQRVESHACAGGVQEVWEHESKVLGCTLRFGVFTPGELPEDGLPVLYWLSGLTCSEQNFITKAGAQRYAAEHGVILVAPDTSPRGDDVADDEGWDLGKGAGFYVNATQEPWSKHYRMYDYIVDELPALVEERFPTNGKRAISGHSMGGHGALMIALKNPGRYTSASAFSPIVAPTKVPWGHKAFSAYLGDDRDAWKDWDTTELLLAGAPTLPMLVDQGLADSFFEEQLQTGHLVEAAQKRDAPVEVNLREGYDHSYYFVSSFIGDHVAFHARHLGAS